MTALHPEAAQAFLEAIKDSARDLGTVTYNLTSDPYPAVKLRCDWKPNLSYGRYQEPIAGDAEFQWEWALWTREAADNAPAHQTRRQRGWTGLPHEGYALRLLSGEPWADVKADMLAQGQTLAARFTRSGHVDCGPLCPTHGDVRDTSAVR